MPRVRTIHTELGLTPPALESFQVSSMLRAADISMRTPPLQCLPILPLLLHHLCSITSSLGSLVLPSRCVSQGTLASGTLSWLPQASRFWSCEPRPTSRSIKCQCSPSQKCRDTLQTQPLPTVSSSHLPLTHQQICLSSLTFIGGIAPWS